MAYVTNYKKNLILNAIRISEITKFLDNSLEFGFEKCLLFSDYEKQEVLIAKNLFLNWEELLKMNNYPVKRLVEKFNSSQESYYLYSSNCHRYHKDFRRGKIGEKFKDLSLDEKIGKEKLSEYKEWLKKRLGEKMNEDNEQLKSRVFGEEHIKKWGKEIKFPEYQEKKNSGHFNLNENEIKNKIVEIKRELSDYWKNLDRKRKYDLKKIMKDSYIAVTNDEKEIKKIIIRENLKELREIDKIKKEIIKYMKLYYISIGEPDPKLLKLLGFRKCSCCR